MWKNGSESDIVLVFICLEIQQTRSTPPFFLRAVCGWNRIFKMFVSDSFLYLINLQHSSLILDKEDIELQVT